MHTATNDHNTSGFSHILRMFPGLLEVVVPSQRSRNSRVPSSQSRSHNKIVIRLGDGLIGRRLEDVCNFGRTVYTADTALDDFEIGRFECRNILESRP